MQAEEAQIDLFQSGLPIGVISLDPELRLLQHNAAFLTLIDAQGALGSGRFLYDILPSAQPAFQPLVERALADGVAVADSVKLELHGSFVYWDVSVTPQFDEDGGLNALLIFLTNLTNEVLNAQLLDLQVLRRNQRLEALVEIARITTEVSDLDKALPACLKRVLQVMQASGAAIQLYEGQTGKLKLAAHVGLPAAYYDWLGKREGRGDYLYLPPEGAGPILIDNSLEDARTALALQETDINTLAALPLIAKGKTLGFLSVLSEKKNALALADISLLTSVSAQIAGIIEMVNLHRERERYLIVTERSRLARELHDAVTQSLYSLMLFAGAIKRGFGSEQYTQVGPLIGRLEDTAHQALKEMRLLLHNLRPVALAEAGLIKALRQRLDAVEGRAQIDAKLEAPASRLNLAPKTEEALYFIANEALNNSLKHSGASQVRVAIEHTGGQLWLTIQDDGEGFDLTAALATAGLGLQTMHEHAAILAGELQIETAPGQGCRIEVVVPLGPENVAAADRDRRER